MADVNIGSDALLTTILTDNDRVTITRAETGQEVATITVGDLKKNIPYVGENMIANTATHSGQWYWFPSDTKMTLNQSIVAGKRYTVSYDVVSITGNGFNLVLATSYNDNTSIQYISTISPDFVGKRISVAFDAARDYAVGAVCIGMGTNLDGGTIANVKIELGANATPYIPNPADIARVMDYSILTEQVVPGEFWADPVNGQPKQVFCRAFTGITSTNSYRLANLGLSVSIARVVTGYVRMQSVENANAYYNLNVPLAMTVPASNPLKIQHLINIGINEQGNIILEGETMFDKESPKSFTIMGTKFSVTIKYIYR